MGSTAAQTPSAAEAWRRIEGSAELLMTVLAKLDDGEDLSRAAAVSKSWRDAAFDDKAWERLGSLGEEMPLLVQLKAEPWCKLGWRQLYVQQRRCDYSDERVDAPARPAIGPRLELEHYRAHVGDSKIPEGCVQVTCAMLEKNDLYKRLDVEYEQSMLDKGRAIFSHLPVPPTPIDELAADLGRTARRRYPDHPEGSYAASLMNFSAPDDSWFEAHIHVQNDAISAQYSGDPERTKTELRYAVLAFHEFDSAGKRAWFGRLLGRKPAQLRKVIAEMKAKRDDYWSTTHVKNACRRTIAFCDDVLARKETTKGAPTRSVSSLEENNIRKAEPDDEDDAECIRLIYDDLIPTPEQRCNKGHVMQLRKGPWLNGTVLQHGWCCNGCDPQLNGTVLYEERWCCSTCEYDLCFECVPSRTSLPYNLKLPILETRSTRSNFMLGVEIYSDDGDAIYSALSELSTICSATSNEILELNDIDGCPWTADRAEVPRLDVFLLRKSDHSRLCLATDASNGHAHDDDYGSGTSIYNQFIIDGTGFQGVGSENIFNKMHLQVRMETQGQLLAAVTIEMEDEIHDEWLDSSVESLLQAVESPGFASRWVAPHRNVQTQALASYQTSKIPRLATPFGSESVSTALQLLTKTAVVRSRAPPVMTLVFAKLEVKDLMQASEVCRDWREAAAHKNSWLKICESEPLVIALYDMYPRRHSRKQLYIQQVQANQLVSAPFAAVSCSDYRFAVELTAAGRHEKIVTAVVALPADGQELMLDHDSQEVVNYTLDQPIEISLGHDGPLSIALKLSLIRASDGKRLHLVDITEYDYDESIAGAKAHHNDDASGCNDAFSTLWFDCRIELQDDEDFDNEEYHTRKITNLSIDIDGYAVGYDMLLIPTLGGLLQMVECPGYAHLWV